MKPRSFLLYTTLLSVILASTPAYAFLDELLSPSSSSSSSHDLVGGITKMVSTTKEEIYESTTKSAPSDFLEILEEESLSFDFFVALSEAVDNTEATVPVRFPDFLNGHVIGYSDYYSVNVETVKDGLLYAIQHDKIPGSVSEKTEFADRLITAAKQYYEKQRKRDPKLKALVQAAIKHLWEGSPEELATKLSYGLDSTEYLQYAVKIGKAKPSAEQSLENNGAVNWASVQITDTLIFRIDSALSSITKRNGSRLDNWSRAHRGEELPLGQWLTDPEQIKEFYDAGLLSAEERAKQRIPYNEQRAYKYLNALMSLEKVGRVAWQFEEQEVKRLREAHKPRPGDTIADREYGIWRYTPREFYALLEDGIVCAIALKEEKIFNKLLSMYLEKNQNTLPEVLFYCWSRRARFDATGRDLFGKVLRTAIENKSRFNPDLAFVTAYNLGDEKTAEALLATRSAFPQELVLRAPKDSLAKSLLRKAILAGQPITEYQNGGLKRADIAKLFAQDQKVLAKLQSLESKANDGTATRPFEAYAGGNIPSGSYYIARVGAMLQSDIRIPKGATVTIDLLGNTLGGADIIVAKGGTLTILNGSLFPDATIYEKTTQDGEQSHREIRSKGNLTLKGVTVKTNVINAKGATLTLGDKTSIGDENPLISRGGPSDMERALMTGKEWILNKNHSILRLDTATGITNEGTIIATSNAYVSTIINTGTIKGRGLLGLYLHNQANGTVDLSEWAFSLIENDAKMTLHDVGSGTWIENSGTMTLHNAVFMRIDNLENAVLELAQCYTGWTPQFPNKNFDTTMLRFNAAEGRIYSSGTLAFSGDKPFERTRPTILAGEIVGHALNDPSKPYSGKSIVLAIPEVQVGQILVKEMLPGKFIARLPDGFFPEESESSVPGLTNLVVVEE